MSSLTTSAHAVAAGRAIPGLLEAGTRLGPVVALLTLLVVGHFLPFERASLAPDDYANLLAVRKRPYPAFVQQALTHPDRPVNLLVVYLQELVVNLNPATGFALLLCSSALLTLLVYLVLHELLGQRSWALLGAALHLVFPSKLELYHTLIYANINVAFSLYLAALLGFLRFARTGRRAALSWAWLAYTVAVFWYEVGFFLPVVLCAYAWWYDRRRLRAAAGFFAPALLYVAYRLTGAFGLYDPVGGAGFHEFNWPGIAHNAFVMIPNQFLGRHMIRAVLYGLYKFPSMEWPWLGMVLLADVAALWGLVAWLRGQRPPAVERRLLGFGIVMFLAFLAPSVLYTVESRHTTLAALGLVLWMLAALAWCGRSWRPVAVAVIAGWLLVGQGTAWIQVVACRINAEVFHYLHDHRAALSQAERVVVDTASFTERIPYTWGERQTNRLNAYYGMQAFAPWGLSSMVRLVTDPAKPVSVARSRPQRDGEELVFEVQVDGPLHRLERVPESGTVVIAFEQVYASGFRNGRAAPATGEPRT